MLNFSYPKFWQTRSTINYLLLPFSLIYLSLGYVRKLFTKQIHFSAKVICVGNISIGGTGKTQVVIMLSKLLKSQGVRFVIITKGYKGNLVSPKVVHKQDNANLVGDESVLLRNYGNVIATKKTKWAKALVEQFNPEVIILDDGMQDPNIYKDVTIVCVDNIRMFGNEFLLPAGPLRESVEDGIQKADLFIMIGNKFKSINNKGSFKTNLPTFNARISSESNILDKSKRYFVFCGIGDPERFLTSVKMTGVNIIGHKFFSDHHKYSSNDLKYLNEQKTINNAELITTEKDYIKLKNSLLLTCFKSSLIIDRPLEFTKILYEKLLKTN